MTLDEAIRLIKPAIHKPSGTWADIGAGTGMFTKALMEILDEGQIIAVDKSPHALYQSKIVDPASKIAVEIIEGDFNHTLSLPPLDGIVMANALHYASDPIKVLKNVISSLKQDGIFILVEYETDTPNNPWVPFPVPFKKFMEACLQAGLQTPEIIGKQKSVYHEEMYAVRTSKIHQSVLSK